MKYTALLKNLTDNNIEFKTDYVLAPYTTWQIGGPADVFVTCNNRNQLLKTIQIAKKNNTPITIIGGGSNILISDEGIKGVVIKFTGNNIYLGEDATSILDSKIISPRLIELEKDEYTDFTSLDYNEQDSRKIEVKIESGAILPSVIQKLLNNDITGLQWFAGIPGTLGGAIYNNIHGGTHYISEVIKEVEVIDNNNQIKIISHDALQFDYDYSRFHNTDEIIISATLILFKGDVQKAQKVATHWILQKQIQPKNSAGCVFKNITEAERSSNNLRSNSWGYIIDNIFNLKEYTVGKASISSKHAAFIETEPGATAKDVLTIIDAIIQQSKEKFKISPKLEIILLGFSPQITEKYKS